MRVRSKLIILGSCIVLAGCFGGHKPAPVTMYGTTAGAGSAGIHTVTSGETLFDISKRYNIVMRDIVVSNNLNAPFTLEVGQRLKLPAPQEYRVRAGDSLSAVARLFSVSQTEVASLNQLSAPYVLRPGTFLKLPSITQKTSPFTLQEPVAVASAPVGAVEAEVLAPPSAGSPAALPPKKPEMQVASAAPTPKAKITTPTPARSSSRFLTPVQGRVISGYGSKENGLHNDGINIAAPRGASVAAADNGVVVYAGNELKGSGNLVLIRHADRWMTAYAHMDKITVKRGDVIKRGAQIGTVGTTGSVDTPQLHFEVRRGTEAINPQRYLES